MGNCCTAQAHAPRVVQPAAARAHRTARTPVQGVRVLIREPESSVVDSSRSELRSSSSVLNASSLRDTSSALMRGSSGTSLSADPSTPCITVAGDTTASDVVPSKASLCSSSPIVASLARTADGDLFHVRTSDAAAAIGVPACGEQRPLPEDEERVMTATPALLTTPLTDDARDGAAAAAEVDGEFSGQSVPSVDITPPHAARSPQAAERRGYASGIDDAGRDSLWDDAAPCPPALLATVRDDLYAVSSSGSGSGLGWVAQNDEHVRVQRILRAAGRAREREAAEVGVRQSLGHEVADWYMTRPHEVAAAAHQPRAAATYASEFARMSESPTASQASDGDGDGIRPTPEAMDSRTESIGGALRDDIPTDQRESDAVALMHRAIIFTNTVSSGSQPLDE